MEENNGSEESRGDDVPPTANMTRQKRKIIKPQFGYDPQRGMWTIEEKRRFLDALKKHGCLNIAALQREVQTKSEEAIKLFITHCTKNARYLMEKKNGKRKTSVEGSKNKKNKFNVTDEAIDLWLQHLHAAEPPGYSELKSLPIARAFLYISKYEEHPDPKDCEGVDFKSLYETLYYMLCGLPGKQLNNATIDFFENTIDELTKLVSKPQMSERSDVLREVSKIHYPPSVRKYPGKKQLAPHQQEDFLLELQGYNPLRVPHHYLSFSDLNTEQPPVESENEVKTEFLQFMD